MISIQYVDSNILKQFYSIFDKTNLSNSDRIFMWKAAVEMFKSNPLFGVGLGNFYIFYPQYRSSWADLMNTSAHSNYFQILAELGIIGLISYLITLIVPYWYLLKTRSLQKYIREASLFIYCASLSFLMQGFFDHNLFVVRTSILYWISIGLFWGIIKMGDRKYEY